MKQIVSRIFSILTRQEQRKLFLLVACDVLITMLDIGFLLLLLAIVQVFAGGASPLPGGVVVDLFARHSLTAISLFFLAFTLKSFAGVRTSAIAHRYIYSVASRISGEKMRAYFSGSYHQYVQVDSSVFNRAISQQPIEFAHYVLGGFQQSLSQWAMIIVTAVAIAWVNPLVFPLLLVLIAPPVAVVFFLIRRKLARLGESTKRTGEKAMQYLQEGLAGFVESNIYDRNEHFADRYYREQRKMNEALADRLSIQSLPSRLIEIFAVLGLLLLVAVSYWLHPGQGIAMFPAGALLVAAYKIIPGAVKLINLSGQMRSYAYSAEGLIAEAAEVRDAEYPARLKEIEFDHINFTYHERRILKGFSFAVSQGEIIGISAVSGRGKTTIVNLLLGFLESDAGEIRFNGAVADAAGRRHYWPRISYVKQQTFLLRGSLQENVTLSHADVRRVQFDEALRASGVRTLASDTSHDYGALITENGKNFSGGQRQRIAFARALYKNADLLILDEPFNELDEEAELDMLRELRQIAAAGRMIILITHNHAALRYCDRQIHLDEH